MAQFYSLDDFDSCALDGKTVGVLGFGNQGHAHALNLRDSGVSVLVGSRVGTSFDRAVEMGFEVVSLAEASIKADVLMLSLPDVALGEIFPQEILPHLSEGQTLLFAHGFSYVYQLVSPPDFVDVGLVSPKGAGAKLRSEFVEGRGLAAFISAEQDASGSCLDTVLAYANGIGCFRSVVIGTTAKEETHTDLFGEQTVLCGGIPELLKSAFNCLVKRGYSEEAAYFECIHEAKLITDLIYARGIAGMRGAISDTAAWGGLQVGRGVVNSESEAQMEKVLDRIQSGEFAEEWIRECQEGKGEFNQLVEEERTSENQVGKTLREKMNLSDS